MNTRSGVRWKLRWPVPAHLLSPTAWTPQTACYLAYRLADYLVQNLGEDAALVALAFC